MKDIYTKLDKSEQEIMSSWIYNDKVYISCICITFNQDIYIERAINSILNQVTTYKFELVIHDDCSTDSTRDIILKYKEIYPNIIKVKIQNDNMYSKGYKITPLAIEYTEGEFVAFCEGDDYWLDEYKLQKQINALLSNVDINICVHDALCKNDNGTRSSYSFPLSKYKEGILSFSEFATVYTQFSPTASMFCRRNALIEACDKLSDAPCGDLFIEIYLGVNNGFYNIEGKLSVYNLKTNGSHAKLNDNSIEKNILFKEKVISHLEKVSKEFQGLESKVILEKKDKYEYNLIFYKSQSRFLSRFEVLPKWFYFICKNKRISSTDLKILFGLLGFKVDFMKKLKGFQ
ncbi:glycosyltransferase [Vibrio fluvialis]|nr:glycosyltransferase [Vibrio fluvialis]